MNTLYRALGERSIRAESAHDAAMILARRLARRTYGRRGDCSHVTLQSWSLDGTSGEWQAFIGIPNRDGMTGRDVRFVLIGGVA